MRLRSVGLCALLAAAAAIAGTIACTQHDPASPSQHGDSPLPEPNASSGLMIGPIDGLTTAWHDAPRSFVIPRGTEVVFKCRAPLGAEVAWEGATEISRDASGSIARCPTDFADRHHVAVRIGPGEDRNPDDGGLRSARYTCSFRAADVSVDDARFGIRAVDVHPLGLDDNSTNYTIYRRFVDGSIAKMTRADDGVYVTAAGTRLVVSATSTLDALTPLTEWRLNGRGVMLGGAGEIALPESPGRHRISVGDDFVEIVTYSVRVVSDIAPGAPIPIATDLEFRAVTTPSGYEDRVQWLASTWTGSTSRITHVGATFTVRFDDAIDEEGEYWVGVRADNTIRTFDGKPECDVADAQAAAAALAGVISIGSGTVVYQSCDIAPNTVVSERLPEGVTGGASLSVPSTAGNYYVFFIDDEPESRYGHPVRYAWVDYNSGTSSLDGWDVVEAEFPPVIDQPGVTEGAFIEVASFTVGGTTVRLGGGGGTTVNSHTHKPALSPVSGSSGTTNWKKVAVCVDLGDADTGFGDGLADQFADDATDMHTWLLSQGFTPTQRISQYWGNSLAALKPAPSNSYHLGFAFDQMIAAWAAYFQCDATSCCHEFFLYLGGHGRKGPNGGLEIYSPAGTGPPWLISWSSLFNALDQFPDCVKIIVMLDACYSGYAITTLSGLCAGRDCGVTVVTAADATNTAPGGIDLLFPDSATQDFMEGAGQDLDGDGKNGDFGDRWMSMQSQGAGYGNPQRFMCAGQTSMCSTD